MNTGNAQEPQPDADGEQVSIISGQTVTSIALSKSARRISGVIGLIFLFAGLIATLVAETPVAAVVVLLIGSAALFFSFTGRVPLKVKIAGAEVDVSFDGAFEAGRGTGADRAASIAATEIGTTNADPALLLDLIERINTRLEALTESDSVQLDDFPRSTKDLAEPSEIIGYRGPVACRAAGVTPRQLDYWARTGLVQPTVRPGPDSGPEMLYSFHGVLILKVVKRLLDTGVSLQQIRIAVRHLAGRSAEDLTQITVMSDGASVYEATSADEVIDLVQSGQGVFGIAIGRVWREVEATLAELPAERGEDN